MSMLTDVKKLLQIKYKPRHDSICDQYNRIFMVKVLLVAAFITGLNWYKDDITCIIPKTAEVSPGYVKEACWINGFYIFKQLKSIPNFYGYYGIPVELDHNGTKQDDSSNTCVANGYYKCLPMTKIFYLQYQWFPFLVAALSLFFYLPYLIFKFINSDLISLKNNIKLQSIEIKEIVSNYFNSNINVPIRQNLKVFCNISVKIFYLLANILTFETLDHILNKEFKNYGIRWFSWANLDNSNAHNYVGIRKYFKASEVLLPTFGICDVRELNRDIKRGLTNEYRFICEISQNIVYHYVLIALWLLLVVGIVISCFGVIECLVTYYTRMIWFAKEEVAAKRVYNALTLRQRDYLDFIRKKNLEVYGKLIRALNEIYFIDTNKQTCCHETVHTKHDNRVTSFGHTPTSLNH